MTEAHDQVARRVRGPLHAPRRIAAGLRACVPTMLGPYVQLADPPELQGFAVGPWASRQNVADNAAGMGVDADWREEAERPDGVTRTVGAAAGQPAQGLVEGGSHHGDRLAARCRGRENAWRQAP